MSYFEFPHTRSYDGDLGYIIKRINELTAKYGEFMEYNQIKFADPVEWNINTVYPAWNIVFANNGYYIAVKPVPAGIMYNNTDYWELIIPFDIDTVLNTESLNPIANSPVARRFNQVSTSISNVVASLRNEGRQREEADEVLRHDIDANTTSCETNAAAISSERTARETADTSLSRDIETVSARVDNIAQTIVPGGTSGDAELADIRVGANGITYATAGDAVRDQIDAITDVLEKDITYALVDGYYNASGVLSSPSSYNQEKATTKINVKNTANIEWKASIASSHSLFAVYYCTWDKDGDFIARTAIAEPATASSAHGTVTIDDTVGYVAFYLTTFGLTESLDLFPNFDFNAINKQVVDLEPVPDKISVLAPTFDYDVVSGYYDANGVLQPASDYNKEMATTIFNVMEIGSINWELINPSSFGSSIVALVQYDYNKDFISRDYIYGPAATITASDSFDIAEGTGYIALYWRTYGSNDVVFNISGAFDFNKMAADVVSYVNESNDIVKVNQDGTNNVLASRWPASLSITPLTMMWFTDIHMRQPVLDRVLEYKAYLESLSMLNDTICTGDLVMRSSAEASQFETFWDDNAACKDIMVTCGNHEWYAQNTTPHGKLTVNQINSIYFNNVANWDVVRSGTDPFYYKDYTDQGIRLIVCDPAVTDEDADETTWLNTVLADAITNHLSVIVASHYLRGDITYIDNDWTNYTARDTGTASTGYDWEGCDIIGCVNTFVANGGEFICYMIGHSHADYLAYPTGHPEQLIISLASASWNREETPLNMSDLARFANTRTCDCFNIITFDSTRKQLKCIRIGADQNFVLKPRRSFAYDYNNNAFIAINDRSES